MICFPLKTETLPPATHTNCFVVGRDNFVVIDAAARDDSERQKLFVLIDSFIAKDFVCRAIIVSHQHEDHFGAETVLQKRLRGKFDLEIPVAAHRLTAESLRGKVKIGEFLAGGEVFQLNDGNRKSFELKVLYTPGHTRGHLAFYDEAFGFLLSSENVVGTGSVLIALPEGNMKDYLASLERLKNLRNRVFCVARTARRFLMRGVKSKVTSRIDSKEKGKF